MENRKEEILGLKRLLVGVIISALLVAMLPIENLKNLIAKADTGVTVDSLTEYSVFEYAEKESIKDTEDADGNPVTAEEALLEILSKMEEYPDGVIIKNESGRDLDFGNQGLAIPAGLVGIELGSTSMLNIGEIYFDDSTGNTGRTDYKCNLYILGDGTNSKLKFMNYDVGQNTIGINANQRLVLYGVDVVDADIVVYTNDYYGAAFGYDEIYYELPKQENDYYPRSDWYAMYREGKGVFCYESYEDALYIDKLFPEMLESAKETNQFDLKLYGIALDRNGNTNEGSTSKQVYAIGVMQYIATEIENCKLSYFGTNPFLNPGVAVYTDDDERGVYTITEEDDGSVIRIYEYHNIWTDLEEDNTTGNLEITDSFYEGNSQADETYDKVVFEQGAIATTFETEMDGEIKTFSIENIIVGYNSVRKEPELVFNMSNMEADFKFFNRSASSITIMDDDANSANEVWAMWSPEINGDATISGGETTEYDGDTYAKAGSVFKFTPPEDYTFTNIHIGDFSVDYGASHFEYYYMSGNNMANLDFLQIDIDGSMELTMPSRMLNFYAATVEMEEIELDDQYATIDKDPVSLGSPNDGTYDTYVAPITVIARQDTEFEDDGGVSFSGAVKYIYELASMDSDEGWTNSIIEMEAGEGRTVVYYMIDRSMQKEASDVNNNGDVDEIPADTYGQITKLTYTYTLIRLAPTEDMYKVEVLEAVDGWSKDAILITGLEGNTLSTTEDGRFTETLTITDEVESFVFYIRTEDGEITSAVVLNDVKLDKTAPEVLYTDATNLTATELVTGGSYTGNLYLNIQDNGVGFDALELYRVDNGVETLCADRITYTGTTGCYYIVPDTEDVTYKLVVKDKLGNEKTYENITVKGYSQDIRVEVNGTEGYYGKDLVINITIYNESQNDISILDQVLRADSPFSEAFGSIITSIPVGESASTTVTIVGGANVGEYSAKIDFTYLSLGASDETSVKKVLSQEIVATIKKAEGTGSVSVSDFCFGEKLSYDVKSETHGTGNVTLYFKEADNATAEFTQDIPTKAGKYIVRAVFAETENYLELVVDNAFVISRIAATKDMYTVSTEIGGDNWSAKDVVISAADGYMLSLKEDGTFTKELTITESVESYTFYIKTESGAITEAVVLEGIKIDKTAPVVLYTDATNLTATELVTGGSYTGNLYLNIQDNGVGFDVLELYKVVNGVETLCADRITYTGTTGCYYIVPDTEDVTYKLVVADKLGNEKIYENIIVKGYSQDIRVEVNGTEGYYGKDLVINITIYNDSENDISILNQVLRTDSPFSEEFGSIMTSISAGKSANTTITIAGGANAGEYLAIMDLTYLSLGASDETSVKKVLSQEIVATVKKVEGTGSVSVSDFCFGEELSYDVKSETHGTGNVTLYFKEADNTTAEFTQDIPTKAGKYIVRAVFAETENYLELVVDNTFVISRIAATKDMYTVSTEIGGDNWYVGDIVISAADGYLLSLKEDGTFTKELTIMESVESYTFYIKAESGAITEAVVLEGINIDKTAPEFGENEGIYAAKTWWQKFLEIITFNLYKAKTDEIKIVAHDSESGIKTISYYISSTAISAEEIGAITEWVVGDSVTIHRDDYKQYVVYARIENNAGLVRYISSDGIEFGEDDVVEPDEPETPNDEPEKEESVSKISGGVVSLKKGTAYQLEEGTWTVTGDNTNYVGGITFYVDEDGEYEFKKQGGQVNE